MVPSFEGIANCSFYGVYDGHSTVMIAELLKERLHSYIINYFTQQADMKQSMAQGNILFLMSNDLSLPSSSTTDSIVTCGYNRLRTTREGSSRKT